MPRSSNARAIKKAISLPPDLARFATATAREEGKTVSAVVQDAMRAYRLSRLKGEYRDLQSFWSQRARDRGILTERDLQRYLAGKSTK
ncbi:MAG: hypothetical protein AMXMBFR45_20770 [Gammaproteobacteria bacterium]|nr:CopG family transcriptional regulator [Gammaproteobacteria bacterium]MCE7896668.1 CopG family transcriptional regulator [Gammaproteobacteria bacterium PRO8]MCQ3934793.1 CopG family transcriptional regulator [Gammaproteobacteria bacterium]MDL1881007.1 CopG family transcriptional regulator [Gammaproteobacteria bacterium PRO2]GIK35031.1 MAG: hypothetical protein BroJett010_15900 [Gammaproteobacteria bacterium]